MGGFIFVLILIFVVLPLLRGAGKKSSRQNSSQQWREAYLRRLSPEQRAQMEKLRDRTGGSSIPTVVRAGDLFVEEKPAYQKESIQEESRRENPADDPFAESFYDEEWAAAESQPSVAAPIVHDHVSPDCVYDEAPTQTATYYDYGNRYETGTNWDFDTASRGSRLKANDNWKFRPPVIAPARPAPPSMFQESASDVAAEADLFTDVSDAPKISRSELRRAVVMSEVLKRPRPGVAPRYR